MDYLRFILAVITTLALPAQGSSRAPQSRQELEKLLTDKDSLLFRTAFYTCEVPSLETIFTEDFEFYHDRGGLTEVREPFLTGLEHWCTTWKSWEPGSSKRILEKASHEVFPLFKNGEWCGAIQTGIHRFKYLNDEKEYEDGDIARFTHVRILENNEWKEKRELGYDHRQLKVNNTGTHHTGQCEFIHQ